MTRVLLRVALLALLTGGVATPSLPAQTAAPAAPAAAPVAPAEAEMRALVGRIRDKLRQGADTPVALAEEIAEFDRLVAKYRESDATVAAQILFSKAVLFLQVFEDNAGGEALLQQVVTDFPGTGPAEMVPRVLADLQERAAAEKAKAALIGQPAPDMAFHWASEQGLQTLSSLKGKVVVLDFWATWCGPCVASFPQIRELVEHYKGYPVEVIGVTSLQGRVHGLEPQPIDCRGQPEKETGLMPAYIKAKEINWTIAFSEQPVFNPAYGVTGIPHMAIVGPDGVVRHNGIHPGALPLAEKVRLIDALLQEAGLPVPKALENAGS